MHEKPVTPLEVLQWCNSFALGVQYQELGDAARSKNRVILTFRNQHTKEVLAVGGISLAHCVHKACVLINASPVPTTFDSEVKRVLDIACIHPNA